MSAVWQILAYIGAIESIVLIGTIVYATTRWGMGIFPALLRLGNGLAKRRIAVFAKGDNLGSLLRNLLLDSRLFSASNIVEISRTEDIGRAESASMFLMLWHDWADDMDKILDKKSDECALIVYAPYDRGRIPDAQMAFLDGRRHTAITNFRGRLLNDILVSMITTSYEKD